MATAHTPFPIRGKIKNLIFKIQDDRQLVYAAPSEFRPRKHGPAYTLNKDEFAGAAKIAHSIYKHIKHDKFIERKPAANHEKLGPIFQGHAQNLLTARLKKMVDIEGKRASQKPGYHFATKYRFHDAVRALKGLDLSNDGAPSGHVSMMPVGPQHNPTAIKVQGLHHAARAIDAHGNAQLECRFHIRQSRVMELDYEKDDREWHEPYHQPRHESEQHKRHVSKPTAWIPVDIIPQEGITLPLPHGPWHKDDKYLSAVMIEWREIRTTGRRAIRHHKLGIVRIAALHAPIEAWKPLVAVQTVHPRTGTKPKPSSPRPRIDPKKDPVAYLKQAIAQLHPE